MKSGRHLILFLLILVSIGMGCASSNPTFSCENYDWSKVEALAQPHLDDFEMTSLVMQGQSSEYHTAAAADHALAFQESYPDSVIHILELITKKDCK